MSYSPNLFEQPEDEARLTPRGALARVGFDVGLGALLGAGLATHIFAVAWSMGEGLGPLWSADRAFATIVGGATVLGFAAYGFALPRFWREARSRVTPWVAVGVSLWIACSLLLNLKPLDISGYYTDPRYMIPSFALLAELALVFVAALAIIDWRIKRDEEIDLEKNNG